MITILHVATLLAFELAVLFFPRGERERDSKNRYHLKHDSPCCLMHSQSLDAHGQTTSFGSTPDHVSIGPVVFRPNHVFDGTFAAKMATIFGQSIVRA